MPLLIINMGGEMLYILEQRLKAQNIPEDKGQRVHQDVMSTMFSEQFITELFKPQKVYSTSSTRLIFDRLAHSSIMRLNESSMNKLFDLMTMGAKYQVLAAACAEQLTDMSLNHLEALRKMVKSPEVIALLDSAIKETTELFAKLAKGDWVLLRHTLARFFQDRRVKVSLFLHDGIQSSDGSIVIQHKGPLPPGADKPGTIRYFDEEDKMIEEVSIDMKNAQNVTDCLTKRSNLGQNLYAKDRRKKTKDKLTKHVNAPTDKEKPFEPDETSKKAATAELNSLAKLLGGGNKTTNDKFTLSQLFPDTAGGSDSGGDGGQEVIAFDAQDASEYAKSLQSGVGFWGDMGDAKEDEEEDDDDDLLSLMDMSDIFAAQKGGAKISGGALGPSFRFSSS